MVNNPDVCIGTYGNGGIGLAGRPTAEENAMRDAGSTLRDHLCNLMHACNLIRVSRDWSTSTCESNFKVLIQRFSNFEE